MIRLNILMGPDKVALDKQLVIQQTFGWIKLKEYIWSSKIGIFYAYQLININQQ
jgi:hypothetical protein